MVVKNCYYAELISTEHYHESLSYLCGTLHGDFSSSQNNFK